MPTYNTPKRGVAFKFYTGLVDQSNTKLLKANPTIAAGDFQISKDGGAFTNLTTLPSANPASGRAVMIDLSASEMTADNIVIQCVDAAGAEWCDQLINLQTTANQLDDIPAAVWAVAVDGATTAAESMRLQNSALGGKATGMGTTTAVFRDLADTKARITATVDTDGNRSVVNRDLT